MSSNTELRQYAHAIICSGVIGSGWGAAGSSSSIGSSSSSALNKLTGLSLQLGWWGECGECRTQSVRATASRQNLDGSVRVPETTLHDQKPSSMITEGCGLFPWQGVSLTLRFVQICLLLWSESRCWLKLPAYAVKEKMGGFLLIVLPTRRGSSVFPPLHTTVIVSDITVTQNQFAAECLDTRDELSLRSFPLIPQCCCSSFFFRCTASQGQFEPSNHRPFFYCWGCATVLGIREIPLSPVQLGSTFYIDHDN